MLQKKKKERKKNKPAAFGKQIKKKLIDKNMTQRELAAKLGMQYKYLNYIIQGDKTGTKYEPAICKLLGIELVETVS